MEKTVQFTTSWSKILPSILRPLQGVGGFRFFWMWAWLTSPTQMRWRQLLQSPKPKESLAGSGKNWLCWQLYWLTLVLPYYLLKGEPQLEETHMHMCLCPGHTKCVHVSHFNTFLFHFYIYLMSLKCLHWKQQLICFPVWITLTDFTLEWPMQRTFQWNFPSVMFKDSLAVGRLLHSSESTWWNSNIPWTVADSGPAKLLFLGLRAIFH